MAVTVGIPRSTVAMPGSAVVGVKMPSPPIACVGHRLAQGLGQHKGRFRIPAGGQQAVSVPWFIPWGKV